MFLSDPRSQAITCRNPDGSIRSEFRFGVQIITEDENGKKLNPRKEVVMIIKDGSAEQSFRLPVCLARIVSEELGNFIDFCSKPLAETNPA